MWSLLQVRSNFILTYQSTAASQKPAYTKITMILSQDVDNETYAAFLHSENILSIAEILIRLHVSDDSISLVFAFSTNFTFEFFNSIAVSKSVRKNPLVLN